MDWEEAKAFFKTFYKNVLTKIKEELIPKLKKVNILRIFKIVLVVSLLFGLLMTFSNTSKENQNLKVKVDEIQKRLDKVKLKKVEADKIISKYNLSLNKKLERLKTTYLMYTKASKEEKLVAWVELFARAKYLNNGNSRYNNYDCSSAVNHYHWSWGAKVVNANPQAMRSRALRLSTLGQVKIRKNYRSIKSGDIIIFNPKYRGGPWHCGIVYDVGKGWIKYMDVNAKVGGMGISDVKWGDRWISMVFEVSYFYWIGDTLNFDNRR